MEYSRRRSAPGREQPAKSTPGRFERYLQSHGHDVKRFRITIPGASPLYSDLADIDGHVLDEAKGVADRMAVRLALGQVLDYGRYVPGFKLAVLLAARPPWDMVDLLQRNGVGCVVEFRDNRFTDLSELR